MDRCEVTVHKALRQVLILLASLESFDFLTN